MPDAGDRLAAAKERERKARAAVRAAQSLMLKEARKARTRRLIQAGAIAEQYLGVEGAEQVESVLRLIVALHMSDSNGTKISVAEWARRRTGTFTKS